MSLGSFTEHDGPAYAEFPVQRGDTDVIGVYLQTQDIFTQERRPAPLDGKKVVWVIVRPGGTQSVATTDTGGGLNLDAATGEVLWPMTATFTAALPNQPCQTVIRVESAEGITTWLNGYIVPKG